MKGTEIKEVNTLYNQVTEILTRAIKWEWLFFVDFIRVLATRDM
jgi:hypothetical protein